MILCICKTEALRRELEEVFLRVILEGEATDALVGIKAPSEDGILILLFESATFDCRLVKTLQSNGVVLSILEVTGSLLSPRHASRPDSILGRIFSKCLTEKNRWYQVSDIL